MKTLDQGLYSLVGLISAALVASWGFFKNKKMKKDDVNIYIFVLI